MTNQKNIHKCYGLILLGALALGWWQGVPADEGLAGSSVDELPNISLDVVPLLSHVDTFGSGGQLYAGGQLTSRGSSRYRVRVRNLSGDPVQGSSLIVVVHRIQEAAQLRDVTTQLEIIKPDGRTRDGKPYFYVPLGDRSILPPYGESGVFILEINNPDLLRLYPPVLQVFGMKHTSRLAVERATKILVDKGLVGSEEAREILGGPAP